MKDNNNFISLNKTSWNKLVSSEEPYSNASLPQYGPFMPTEETLQLFKDIKDKKVLEIGCASGKSLEFLAKQGAGELWGLDFSDEQIKLAKKRNIPNTQFILSNMEKNSSIPTNYFDYVLSLYSIGYSSNPIETINLMSSYLKPNGKLILSWTHPFFNCLDIEDNKIFVKHNYIDETPQTIMKGSAKIKVLQHNLKISTLVNTMINSNLTIEKIIEEDPIKDNNLNDYNSSYFNKSKLKCAPTTLIIVAHKN